MLIRVAQYVSKFACAAGVGLVLSSAQPKPAETRVA
jgi:hypothetical protein